MHGRVKVRTTAEQEELKRLERAKKVVQYRAGIDLIFQKRRDKIWDDEIFVVTEQMVLKNPDIYTLWNVRREAFAAIKWNTEEEYVDQLKKELTLTEHCLRANPKSYSVWHQRCWVNDHIPEPDWVTELSLCAKCLNLDERNFHCWDYRQYVVRKAGIREDDEFAFSTTKIESNFSNYSSWHYRSLLLPKMFPDDSGELPISGEKHTEELDLVMNATFTDPNDTSAWFYQRWLLKPRQTSRQVLWKIKMTDERVMIAFNKQVSLRDQTTSIKVDETLVEANFRPCGDRRFDFLWIATLRCPPKRKSVVEIIHEGVGYRLEWSSQDEAWLYTSDLRQETKRDVKHLAVQLDNYKQLAEIEPDNKWALLTGIILMKKIDPVEYHEAILNDLAKLSSIDKLRTSYYNDLRSKYVVDYILDKSTPEELVSRVDLSCMDLTTLNNEQYFSFTEEIHLGGNRLFNSLNKLRVFQSCVKLSLSSNGIESLRKFPSIKSLRFLSLRNNELSNVDDVVDLIRRNNSITELDLRDNKFSTTCDIVQRLAEDFPKLKVFFD